MSNLGENTIAGHDLHGYAPRRSRHDVQDVEEMDITPMIDITFLLLIFFTVGAAINVGTIVSLPSARHGVAVSARSAVVISLVHPGNGKVEVYLADGAIDAARLPPGDEEQRLRVADHVRQGLLDGRHDVLVKADRSVQYRHVARIAAAVGDVEGARLHFAVREREGD